MAQTHASKKAFIRVSSSAKHHSFYQNSIIPTKLSIGSGVPICGRASRRSDILVQALQTAAAAAGE
jgi:hypothetical protein